MGLISEISNKIVFIDTAPLIYYIEGNSKYQKILNEIFDLNVKRKFKFITSTLTLLEVLVLPIKLNEFELVKKFESILVNSETLRIIDLDKKIARKAAEIRAEHKFKTPDSIQLATAIEYSADYFLTNDKKLKVKNIDSVLLEDFINN